MLSKTICFAMLTAMLLCSLLRAAPPTPPPSGVTTVEIRSDGFHPKTVTIKVGDRVKWLNKDTKPHSVGGGKSEPTSGEAFNTSPIQPGKESDPIQFKTAGTIKYHAGDHANWKGTIKVQE